MAVAGDDRDSDFLSSLRDDFESSQSFLDLREAFLAVGRGRRKKIVAHADNRLFVQVFILKEQSGRKTWKETEDFLLKILQRDDLSSGRLRTITEAVVKKLKKQTHETLVRFLDEPVDVDNLGPHLSRTCATRQSLMNCSFDPGTAVWPTNGLMIDLSRFLVKNNLPKEMLLRWFCQFAQIKTEHPPGTAENIKKCVDNAAKTLKKKQGEKGPAAESFVHSPFYVQDLRVVQQPDITSTTTGTNESSTPTSCSEVGGLHSANQALKRELQNTTENLTQSNEEKKALSEELKVRLQELRSALDVHDSLKKKVRQHQQKTEELKEQVCELQRNIQEQEQQLKSLKKTNVVRRNLRLEAELVKLKKTVIPLTKKVKKAKTTKKRMSHVRDSVKKKYRREKIRKNNAVQFQRQLLRENRRLRRETELLQKQNEEQVIRLKDPVTGYFTEDARVCIMELVGQHEIAASRCGEVITTICRFLFHASIPEDDLPSERSVHRFMDMAQVLGKLQVADTIKDCNYFDIHTDGTSRVGKKYVGQQITVDSGETLSLGYTVVATENADCLVDVATDMLEELSMLYEDDNDKQHDCFLENLTKLSGLMSDRAAVMKCFNERFNCMRQDLLQTDEDLDFLYCNAHVLLGLSNAVQKAFLELDAADGDAATPVGREESTKFQGGRRGEHPCTRFIREGCGCLGPRGDERFGCREQWLAYCLMIGRSSEISSFKANRFNNLFQASAALHYHRDDIATFFDTCMEQLNWKQEGLLLDSKSDKIDNHLIALGLLYFRLTGPYWSLLGKPDLHVLDFYRHVVEMKLFLERWTEDPDAFSEDFPNLFDVDMKCRTNNVFSSLINIAEDRKASVCNILKALSRAFLAVLELQLKDFLPGGRYHAVEDAALRDKLKHSKLTNLVGEQAFGDLDFSMFKRRNATAHYHSSMNILKRNKTITHWLLALPPDQQAQALAKAAAKHRQLREKRRQAEKEALVVRRGILDENRRKKAEKIQKKTEQKRQIIENLKPHKGPCCTTSDVDRLLTTYPKQGQKVQAVRAELQYHSVILGKKSPLLQVSKKLPQLIHNLKQFLSGTNEIFVLAVDNSVSSEESEIEKDSVDEDDQNDFGEEASDDADVQLNLSFTFRHVNPGVFVAVGYEDRYYLGQVESTESDSAFINFLVPCSQKKTLYKWPSPADRCLVHEKFVLAAEFEMSSPNGRFWTLTACDAQSIEKKYAAYKNLFFHQM